METQLHVKPPRSDPDRWKPLLQLILPVLIILPLASLEYTLVLEIIRTGNLRGLIQAILSGLILIMLVYVMIIRIWRLVNRPASEELVRRAQAVLDHKLPDKAFVSRGRSSSPPNRLIYAAFPITLLTLAIYGICIDRLVMFSVMLGGAIVVGGAMLLSFSSEKQRLTQSVAFDPVRRVIRFENFQFISTFLPEKPRILEVIEFVNVLGSDFYPSGRGPAMLHIRTTKGSVDLTDQMENFEQVRAIIESVILLNKANREVYQEKLNAEPEIRTAWYGWLILLGAFAAVAFLCWKFMYSD